jgi:pimeloyl-ACP methyl ester carboxylesterase
VARLLRQAGHEVYTPTLTGVGDRAHLMSRTIDLGTHVQDIVGVIHCEELSDVVLCGHSYGGMVIAGVAEQIAAKIRSLVYLDAFVPENGNSTPRKTARATRLRPFRRLRSPSTPRILPGSMRCASSSRWQHSSRSSH